MVRLVFRPYTQVRRSICTSESLRTSTRVSSGFILLWHSSPSFGSQRAGSVSAEPTRGLDGTMVRPTATRLRRDPITSAHEEHSLLSLRLRVLLHPQTRLHAELLGPCFKTGRVSGQHATEQRHRNALRTSAKPAGPHDAAQHCRAVQNRARWPGPAASPATHGLRRRSSSGCPRSPSAL